LVQHLLTGFAFTAPVPRQEDIGVDFMCSLIVGSDEAGLLRAGPFFSVQAKSPDQPIKYQKPHELEWITSQENPLLVCVADRESGAMDVYSTWNLLCAVLNGWKGQKLPNCIRLCPDRSSSDWRGVEDKPDGSQNILLGKPIVRVTHEQIFNDDAIENIAEIIGQWVRLDRQNIVNHRAGLNWVVGPITYETGQPLPSQLAVSFYWHPQNLRDCTVNLGRSATALWHVLQHSGIAAVTDVGKPPWPEGRTALRNVLLWYRQVDPTLEPFLADFLSDHLKTGHA
jgi:hypothetical protein